MEGAAPISNTTPPSNGRSSEDDQHRIEIDTNVWGPDKGSIEERTKRIPKVPFTMRNSQNLKLPVWIKPSVISIGPYHFDENDFQEGQRLKPKHAQKFIDESGQRRDDLFFKITKKTPEFRNWYDHKAMEKFNDDSQLATIFLLDGCFLLNFINYSSREDGFTHLELTTHEMAYIKQDLFLLENQLPYEVLQLLFEDIAEHSNPSMEDKIRDFVASHVPFPRGIDHAKEVNIPSPCSHLLHYLQVFLLGKPGNSPPQKQGEHDERGGGKGRSRTQWHLCRNVQELMKVGIYFKPSPTNYLTDISFKPDDYGTNACLKLPTISMNTSTMIIFLNLVAFESLNTSNKLGVISYLCFLDSLIYRWDDVKELQAAGVLRNFVGEQSDVAQFFNTVGSKLVPNPSAYRNVTLQIKSHVDRHYDNRLRKWYVQCKQIYFSSPWSFFALIAAIIGLSLTAIQAFTSLFPR